MEDRRWGEKNANADFVEKQSDLDLFMEEFYHDSFGSENYYF